MFRTLKGPVKGSKNHAVWKVLSSKGMCGICYISYVINISIAYKSYCIFVKDAYYMINKIKRKHPFLTHLTNCNCYIKIPIIIYSIKYSRYHNIIMFTILYIFYVNELAHRNLKNITMRQQHKFSERQRRKIIDGAMHFY